LTPNRRHPMDLTTLTERAMEIKTRFAEREQSSHGRAWTKEEVMQGFVVDIGDLMKLVMAKSGLRDLPDLDQKLAHELSDCLWSILVLSRLYGLDLEQEFLKTMAQIEASLPSKPQKKV
jgi:NTP pyrophosphatase (non-canonical NTP hydrolase)